MNNLGKEPDHLEHYLQVVEEWTAYVRQHKDAFAKEFPGIIPYSEIVENLVENFTRNKTLTIQQKTREIIRFLNSDIDRLNRIDAISLRLKKKISARIDAHKSPVKSELGFALITLNYDDTKITIPDIKKIQKQMCALPHWEDIRYVHEKHRECGIHHHTHYLVQFEINDQNYKSKFIDHIWAMKGIKNFMSDKQKIDVKMKDGTPYEAFMKYIEGDKKPSKMPFVELDKKWRLENNL